MVFDQGAEENVCCDDFKWPIGLDLAFAGVIYTRQYSKISHIAAK
jgi:hypothetical protein